MRTGSLAWSRALELFTARYPHLASVCWILTAQYFVAQILVGMATESAYDWAGDSISDLGVTRCGRFGGHYVCSPLSAVFNVSLVALGAAMAIGALLFYHQFGKSRGSLVGFGSVAAAAVGTLLVGVFPAGTIGAMHRLGTALAFVGGAVGVLTLSFSLRELPRTLRHVMVSSGIVSVIGVMMLALYFFSGIGLKGLAERVTSFPEVLWLIVFGIRMSAAGLDRRVPSAPTRE